jgi:hypothetical protein
MKKLIALLAVAAIAVTASAAFAATPQGKLTGGALVDAGGPLSGRVEMGAPVLDGGTSYVGASNDLSGNCKDDSGTFKVRVFDDAFHDVVCAHYVASSGGFLSGSPKMRFAYATGENLYTIIRITDNGSQATNDTIAFGFLSGNINTVTSWVNKGVVGAGFAFSLWGFTTVEDGNYTVQA